MTQKPYDNLINEEQGTLAKWIRYVTKLRLEDIRNSDNQNAALNTLSDAIAAIVIPVKATGAELDTATDDAKFATAKALKDSHNVPSVAPGSSGNVMTSDGTDWTSAAPANPIKAANLSYTLSSGTAGPSYAADAWKTVELNTEDFDPSGIVSISSNQFTLAAGTYQITATKAANRAGTKQRLRIYNITDSAASIQSVNYESPNAATVPSIPQTLHGYVTISGSKAFELQIYLKTNASSAEDALTTGESEVYAQVSILKIA